MKKSIAQKRGPVNKCRRKPLKPARALAQYESLNELLGRISRLRNELVDLGQRLAYEAPDLHSRRDPLPQRQPYITASRKAGRVAETLVALELAIGRLP